MVQCASVWQCTLLESITAAIKSSHLAVELSDDTRQLELAASQVGHLREFTNPAAPSDMRSSYLHPLMRMHITLLALKGCRLCGPAWHLLTVYDISIPLCPGGVLAWLGIQVLEGKRLHREWWYLGCRAVCPWPVQKSSAPSLTMVFNRRLYSSSAWFQCSPGQHSETLSKTRSQKAFKYASVVEWEALFQL